LKPKWAREQKRVGNTGLEWHRIRNSGKWPTWRTIPLFYNTFITILYMFQATLCSSSGGQLY